MEYIPLSSFEKFEVPHQPSPATRDPWYIWAIAISPLPPLVALVLLGSSSHLLPTLLILATFLLTGAACLLLARREEYPNPWLALLPAAYLLVRASRRAAGPHRGNPLAPLIVHLLLAFLGGYYVMLFLAAMVQIVNLSR